MAGPAKVTAYLGFNTEEFRRNLTRADKAWQGLESKIKTGAAAAGAAFAVVGTASAAAFGMAVKSGISLNSQLQQAEATFKVFTKSAAGAKDIVAALRNEADRTPFDTAEMIDAGKQLISSAKGSRTELMKLIKTAEVLAALNPVQGLGGAAYAIKEALGGDTNSLAERFDLGRSALQKFKDQGLKGLDLINARLREMGAGPELVNALADTFEGRKSTVMSFWDELKRRATEPLFNNMSNAFADLINYMDGGGKDTFINAADEMAQAMGEMSRDVIEALGKIDIKKLAADTAEWLQTAKDAADWLGNKGKDAKNAAGAVGDIAKGSVAKIAGGIQGAMASSSSGVAGFWDAIGADGLAADARKNAEDWAAKAAGNNAVASANSIDKIAARRFPGLGQAAEGDTGGGWGAPGADELINNWLKARGANAQTLASNPALQQEAYGKLGISNVANYLNAHTPQVKVTLESRNPQHAVMAT